MTTQEIFTTVVTHLRKQNEKSETENAKKDIICAYRGEDGRKCAAGVLIKDEFYSSDLEGHTVDEADVQIALVSSGIDMITHTDLILELQRIHDRFSVSLWEGRFKDLAEKMNLEVPPREF